MQGLNISKDIFTYICTFLPPSSIVALYRTSKSLYDLIWDTRIVNLLMKYNFIYRMDDHIYFHIDFGWVTLRRIKIPTYPNSRHYFMMLLILENNDQVLLYQHRLRVRAIYQNLKYSTKPVEYFYTHSYLPFTVDNMDQKIKDLTQRVKRI